MLVLKLNTKDFDEEELKEYYTGIRLKTDMLVKGLDVVIRGKLWKIVKTDREWIELTRESRVMRVNVKHVKIKF